MQPSPMHAMASAGGKPSKSQVLRALSTPSSWHSVLCAAHSMYSVCVRSTSTKYVLSSRLASRLPPVVTRHSSPPTPYTVYRVRSRSAEMWRRRQSAGKRRSSSSTSGPLDRKEHLCPPGRGPVSLGNLSRAHPLRSHCAGLGIGSGARRLAD